MRSLPLFSFLTLTGCLVELPSTSLGFKCAEDRDCARGSLACVAGVCASRDAGLEDGGVDGGPAVWRLVGYRADFPFPFDNAPGREAPTRGRYTSSSAVIQAHAQELLWAHVNGGVISWFGRATASNDDASRVFSSTQASPLRWALLYEREPLDTPTPSEVAVIVEDAKTLFAQHPNYLRRDGAFVLFVAASKPDAGGCSAASRWVQGNRMKDSPAFLVLVAPGDASSVAGCPEQPGAWRLEEAQPLGQTEQVATLTPGLWPWDKPRALTRDVAAFEAAVRAANDGGQRIQYVNSFNFWMDGTAVESGHERTSDGGVGVSWASDSGMGAFLDVLHAYPPVTR